MCELKAVGLWCASRPGKSETKMKIRHQRDPDGGLAVGADGLSETAQRGPAARPGRGQLAAGLQGPGGLAGGDGNGHGYPAVLVRGSRIAVAMSDSKIATSTATVMMRNSPCMSG